MSEFTAGTIAGFVVGMFLGVIVYGSSSGAFNALNDCESSLPRNQVCELTAKPKQEPASHEQ